MHRGVAPVLIRTCGVALAMSAILWTAVVAQDITVTLLGTGTPAPSMKRFGPSILVEAGGQHFLIDAGRGALQRLTQVKVGWQAIDGVFLTHLHSDHVVGFPDLWLTGWLVSGRDHPVRVWGPRGTAAMIAHLQLAYAFDIGVRESEEHAAPDGVAVVTVEVEEGVVYDKDGVRISAILVDHGPVKPAFGYRVDYRGRSVVFSGDTRVSENLIAHAQGVDLLIHEVVSPEALQRAGISAEKAKARIAHHTTPEQAGDVFARTATRLAVYSHIGPPDATEQELVPATRKRYTGRLEIGEDLMIIEVGDTVVVKRPVRGSP